MVMISTYTSSEFISNKVQSMKFNIYKIRQIVDTGTGT